MDQNIISLSKENKLFSGTSRDVYQHPCDKGLLIKVMNTNRWDRKSKFIKKYFYHYFFSKNFIRETSEYIRIQYFNTSPVDFIQAIVGFCWTNLGFGIIVKAEFSEDGKYAKTLQQLIHNKQINSEVIQHLKIFIEKIVASPVIISDMNLKNIVYSYNKNNNAYQFVLVDGTSDKTWIPVQKLFPWIRPYCKSKYLRPIKEIIQQFESNDLAQQNLQY